MAKKAKKAQTTKKCKQCGIEPCAEMWRICAKCVDKNAEYQRKIDKERSESPHRWDRTVLNVPLKR